MCNQDIPVPHQKSNSARKPLRTLVFAASLLAPLAFAASQASAQDGRFKAGNLLVSRSVYEAKPSLLQVGVTQLPPNCVSPNCAPAINDATYPYVFNNDKVDGSFGITSRIFLDEVHPESGEVISTLRVPSHSDKKDHAVTSFSSKSEIALNLSTDRNYVTFMGYAAPTDAIDVSNSNTPGVVDPTNPVAETVYRVVVQMDQKGKFEFTETNAYSGNNGRAAIMDEGNKVYYLSGNAGNGGNPQPNGILLGGGAQVLSPANQPESAQTPGAPTPVGGFNITQLGLAHDKIGKDNNFRGLTIFDNVVYFSKGSGGNGVNTVYFIDTQGGACPHGVGLPAPNAPLPGAPLPAQNLATLQTTGLQPNNMCILKGFSTTLAKAATGVRYPFGIWFANSTTAYVADEGDGAYADAPMASGKSSGGLQKWVLSGGQWNLAYNLQTGLELGQPYVVEDYPTGINPETNLAWAPETDGLRNITGRVNDDGTVTVWGITSTVSGSGDQGADPNRLVTVTDLLSNTNPAVAGTESFHTVRTARNREVLRGVSFTPGTGEDKDKDHH